MIPIVLGYGLIAAGTLLVASLSGCSKKDKEVEEKKNSKVELQGPTPPVCESGLGSFIWKNKGVLFLDHWPAVTAFCNEILRDKCNLSFKLYACIPNPPITSEEKLDTIAIFSLLLAIKTNQPAGFYEKNKDFIDLSLFNVAEGKVKVREEEIKVEKGSKKDAGKYRHRENTLWINGNLLSDRVSESVTLHELLHSYQDAKKRKESYLTAEFDAYIKGVEYLLATDEFKSDETVNKFLSGNEKIDKDHPMLHAYWVVYDRSTYNPRRVFQEEKLRDALARVFYEDQFLQLVSKMSWTVGKVLSDMKEKQLTIEKIRTVFEGAVFESLQEAKDKLNELEKICSDPAILSSQQVFLENLEGFLGKYVLIALYRKTLEFYEKDPHLWADPNHPLRIVSVSFDDPLIQEPITKFIKNNPKFAAIKGRLNDCVDAENDGV